MSNAEMITLKRYVEELTRQLPVQARQAMPQIAGLDRQLLALRGYLLKLSERDGVAKFHRLWAWTPEQYDTYIHSTPGKAQQKEVKSVIKAFNDDSNNQGYRLGKGKDHRPLWDQIDLWNKSNNVRDIGASLRNKALAQLRRTKVVNVAPPYLQPSRSELGGRQCLAPRTVTARQHVFPSPVSVTRSRPPYLGAQESRPGQQTVVPPTIEERTPHPDRRILIERFGKFIAKRGLVANPRNATPGLSKHGTARAVDFVVYRGRQRFLTTGNATRWRATGFAQRLRDVVRRKGPHLEGPLPSPDEPWHYTYDRP